ncbi:MAG: hypothetical protein ACFFHV_01065 [Promethearchaeota archaeon]
MDRQDFIKQLANVSDLMVKEKYQEALVILEKLKEIEKKGDFDYNLTHKLYQLDSNTRSLYNQEVILNQINALATKQTIIPLKKLHDLIKDDLQIDESMLRREIELLILRDKIQIQINGNELKF